jgi:hypothetical protein
LSGWKYLWRWERELSTECSTKCIGRNVIDDSEEEGQRPRKEGRKGEKEENRPKGTTMQIPPAGFFELVCGNVETEPLAVELTQSSVKVSNMFLRPGSTNLEASAWRNPRTTLGKQKPAKEVIERLVEGEGGIRQ